MTNMTNNLLESYKDELYYSINYLEKFLKKVDLYCPLGLKYVYTDDEKFINFLKEVIERFDKDIKTLKSICFNSIMQYINSIMKDKISDKEILDIYAKIRDVYEQI